MLKRIYLSIAFLTLLILDAPGPVAAQNPGAGPLSSAVGAYLSAAGHAGTLAYLHLISASPSNAWNAGAKSAGSPPQSVPIIGSNGFGQVTIPGVGTLTKTGSSVQYLNFPSSIPLIGGSYTGLSITVDHFADAQGNRIEAATDPLSAFNYSLTHSNYTGAQQTGTAGLAALVADWIGGHASGTNTAVRLDPGLSLALNSNFGQGWGGLFGVGAYFYPAPVQVQTNTSQVPSVTGGVDVSVPPADLPPSFVPPPIPTGGEEVYLKAVIPQAPPDVTLQTQPLYPVIVGQDPTQRGADVLGRAELHPCTVIWHHVAHDYYYYCGPGQSACDCSKQSCDVRESIREWDTTDLEPDALASAAIDAALTPPSAAYITTELTHIYPGSKIYQGQVRVYPSAWARVTAHSIGIPSVWAFSAERIPFADPGDWDFHVALATTGTPHCSALNWGRDLSGLLTVWLREQRLVK